MDSFANISTFVMGQQTKFDHIALFGLIESVNSSDLTLGAHTIQKKKKKWKKQTAV